AIKLGMISWRAMARRTGREVFAPGLVGGELGKSLGVVERRHRAEDGLVVGPVLPRHLLGRIETRAVEFEGSFEWTEYLIELGVRTPTPQEQRRLPDVKRGAGPLFPPPRR